MSPRHISTTLLLQNLDWLFADNPNVFVAGDLSWYTVEGRNTIVNAPDVMVVFERPKGDRGSYQQWKEEGIAPQVVFEILSPSNTQNEMEKKLLFYDRYGVEEYYIYDPDRNQLRGWLRSEEGLDIIPKMVDWISPRLGVRFAWLQESLELYLPSGERFLTYTEITQRAEQERQARRDAIPQLLGMGLSVEQVTQALGLSLAEVQAAIQE